MLTQIRELFSQWKMLKPTAFTAGLATNSPLDHNTTLSGLNHISRNFPQLTESHFDKKDDQFFLADTTPEPERQICCTVTQHTRIELLWGSLLDLDFEREMRRFFECVQEGFQLSPVNISLVDLQFVVRSQWAGNHYLAIYQAFLKDSPLALLFDEQRILQDDLLFRGLLDDNRVWRVSIVSTVADEEVLRQRFTNDVIQARAGVAHTTTMPPDAHAADLFLDMSQTAFSFIKEKFIPSVVEPLDKILLGLSVP